MKLINLKTKAEKLWETSNGFKTIVGIIGHITWFGIHFPNHRFDIDTALKVHMYIGSVTGTGLVHKIIKLFKK